MLKSLAVATSLALMTGLAAADTASAISPSKKSQPIRGGKAQTHTEFPVYREMKLEKPADIGTLTAADFKIDPARVAKLDKGSLYLPAGGLTRLAGVLGSEDGAFLWKTRVDEAVKVVNDWNLISRRRATSSRYIVNLNRLPQLAAIYQLTGRPELGRFVKAHVLQASALPLDFWCFAELRGCDPKKPRGGLETAHLSETIALVMSLTGNELFTADEHRAVDAALRTKGHEVMKNWLNRWERSQKLNNWLAVIATGSLITSKYFNDTVQYDRAAELVRNYLDHAIEDDGSYGEGYSYFSYPIDRILQAAPALNRDEINRIFANSPLRHTSEWLASGYFYTSTGDNPEKFTSMRAAFGDNGYYGRPSAKLTVAVNRFYGDRLLPWLSRNMNNSDWISRDIDTLRLACALDVLNIDAGRSPAELKLPTVKSFASGETFIRKNWEIDAPVLALKRIGMFKTGRAHVRRESNSIAMAAYGEYFIVLPSSASYRSPLHDNYDCSTVSANTVMVDGADQLLDADTPPAQMRIVENFPEFAVVSQDSAPRIAEPMRRAARAAVLLKELDTFVLIDRFEAENGQHKFDARLHFFNRDETAKLTDNGGGNFLLTRPKADLAVFLASPETLTFKTANGYMHSAGRDFAPGGPSEGKPGSALELIASAKTPARNFTLFTVLQPVRKGKKPQPAVLQGSTLEIGGVKLIFDGEKITLYGRTLKLF